MSHTVPFKFELVESFLTTIVQSTVDKIIEQWVDSNENVWNMNVGIMIAIIQKKGLIESI